MKKVSLFLLVLFLTSFSHAGDLGFRYREGRRINSEGNEGLNPSFMGPCSDLRGVNFESFGLEDMDFSGSQFEGANLSDISFNRSLLNGVNFSKATILRVEFIGSKAQGANFANAIVSGSTFYSAELKDCDFSSADFTSSNLSYIKAEKANFAKATFNNTILDGAELVNSQLQGLRLQDQVLRQVNFKDSDLSAADMKNIRIIGGTFSGASLQNANMSRAIITRSNFSNTDLSKSLLSGAELKYSNFNQSRLSDVKLNAAKMASSDFNGADFKNAEFGKTTQLPFSQEEALARGMVYLKLTEFSGIAKDVNLSDLEGWTVCHRSLYNSTTKIEDIQKACNSPSIMLACGPTNQDVLSLAAYGAFAKVFFDVGEANQGIIDNEVQFYFSPNYSLGFAGKNHVINRSSCDYEGDDPELRMCVHTSDGSIVDGYRCGNNELNESTTYYRYFLKADL